METNLQSEFTITESKTETNEFNCPAPTCGRQTHTLYQLVRDYDFLFTRSRRLLGPITRSAGLRQHTKQFDLRQETDENDPQCPCKSKDRRSSRGVLGIKFGDLSLRMDAKMLRHPVPCANVSFGNQNILLRMTEDTYSSNIEAGELPEFVRYLSGITSGNVVISGYPISDEYGALGIYTSEPVQEDLGMPLPDLGSLQEIARERL
jgi:hypothetical protein